MLSQLHGKYLLFCRIGRNIEHYIEMHWRTEFFKNRNDLHTPRGRAPLVQYHWLKKYLSFPGKIIEAERGHTGKERADVTKREGITVRMENDSFEGKGRERGRRESRNIGKPAARQDKTFHKTDIDSVLPGAHVDVNRESSPECSSRTPAEG